MNAPRFKFMMKRINYLFISIVVAILLFFSYQFYLYLENRSCYTKCSSYHLLGEAYHWDYNDYIAVENDTIWVDQECYNDWCICIDECNPGLCCDLLQ